jgi:sulfane dehydrogenase subunit SoxC
MNEPPVPNRLPPAAVNSADAFEPVAGNGLLDRRLFLGTAFLAGAASIARPAGAAAETEPWRHVPGAEFSNYGQPSGHERDVIRWVSATSGAPTNGISWCPLQDLDGIITPNGLHYERHHNGVPDIDPAAHRLVIHGQVERPLMFSIDALLRYPRESRICVIECGGNSNAGWRRKPVQTAVGYFHGLVSCSEWTGVPVSLLLREVGVQAGATWAVAEGADAFGMTVSVPLAKLQDDALLALFQNGERIRPEQGYPLRLVVPGYEGVQNVKWLRTLKISKDPVMARNETSRYTELQPSGKARMFTFEMAVKSVITAPSAGMHLEAPGFYEISGLAWSGSGRISRVEVSADGGETWADAALNEPLLPRCFTRFRIPWQWDGQAVVLQSRATDEAGEVQPARAALLAARGRHGYFHYNAIVSWAIDPQGVIEHAYVDAPAAAEPDDPFDDDWDF